MTQNTGYILNGFPIEYIGINIHDHYAAGGVFLATKIVEVVLIEYSQTGKVIYSNVELMERFKCSRRGLQTAFDALESLDANGKPLYDVIKRTYSDQTKRTRTGIEVNIDTAIKWLSAKSSDVVQLDRGNLFKHFVMQSVIVIKKYASKLKRAIQHVKNNNNKEKWEAVISDLNAKKLEHDSYIKTIINKAKRAIQASFTVYTDNELISSIYDTVMGWGFTNPPN